MGSAGAKAHFDRLARHNRWANRRLYDAVSGLDEQACRAPEGATSPSLLDRLNAMFVADIIWMLRFRGQPNPPWPLDHMAHAFLDELTARRRAVDYDILGFVLALPEDAPAAPFCYITLAAPERVKTPLGTALDHFFAHQCHHRAACRDHLARLGLDAPALDLAAYRPDS